MTAPNKPVSRELKPVLGAFSLWGIAVGLVISGEYFGWSYGWASAGTLGFLVATAFVALMYTTFIFSFTELSTAIPHAGGPFAYARRAFGPAGGFVAGFATLVEFVFAPPAISLAIGAYLGLQFPSLDPKVAALGAYAVFITLNALGIGVAALFELVVTLLAVAELLVFAGVVAPGWSLANFTAHGWAGSDSFTMGTWAGIFASIPFAIWFFLAIEGAAMAAEEAKEPRRTIPIAYISGILTLVALAFLVMVMAGGVGDWRQLANINDPLPQAMKLVVGASSSWLHMLIWIGLFGLVASFHGIILGYSRQMFALARAGYLPRYFAHVHPFSVTLGQRRHHFESLRELMAKATPLRSGDCLAGLAAATEQERVTARWALADVPLSRFLNDALVPYESDEVTRLIMDGHDAAAFAPVASLTVGAFRDWLLSDHATPQALRRLAPGLTPEMVAAVSKLMRNQDLMLVARRCEVVTRFRNTQGLRGHLGVRLQPNHPTDDPAGIVASMIDGLMLGAGDAVVGINPVSDSIADLVRLNQVLDEVLVRGEIPTQSCVLTHVTNTMQAMGLGAPVDLVFQSIAGTQAANQSFGIDLALLDEAHAMAQALGRGTVGSNVMYFETGQGSALSANAHHGVDQQTCEARAYAVARRYRPLLVNTVVGFIGPEYLFDGKQITRAGLEDHFCGKLLGLPMGCDICYTNHAEADQDDMDNLMVLLATAGLNFMMGVPGADDVMLNYQSTSFHDALVLRDMLGLRRAPEFEAWLHSRGLTDADGRLLAAARQGQALPALLWTWPERT